MPARARRRYSPPSFHLHFVVLQNQHSCHHRRLGFPAFLHLDDIECVWLLSRLVEA